ncbi:MAG: tRNA uridine-5-carboxymethylaminomethyl(34) synthesis enzyme MnmG [Ruminococcaceae bacterium]|nr:tRNA uridine-5-carboxymethylaminomethyl(34) synthesis enzyme MnmG [Oscillospiraceae bacterium]
MSYYRGDADIAVIGAGHAGIEAGLAGARLGLHTLVFTINLDAVGNMPCNPSIGGTGKGQLVHEIDAMGGEMGRVADTVTLQSRILNRGKGPAVHSSRIQADRRKYQDKMKKILENTDNLELIQAEIVRVGIEGGKVTEVETSFGAIWRVKACIICSGTYLNGRVITGDTAYNSGPDGMLAATHLTSSLSEAGVRFMRFKTGTPARVHRDSIDFTELEIQNGDDDIHPYSKDTDRREFSKLEQIPCHVVYTNSKTHEIIRSNLDKSPLYSGKIKGTGPRYCPSIEDKVVRFADKERHQLFIEPMGSDTKEMYIQGFSSSMPEEVQMQMLHSLKGFENAQVMRTAYAIEYDCIDPTQLYPTLEFKEISGLYGAGQFNGSSGYEEAAAQGLVAGINAALKIKGEPELILPRSSSYTGTLIDDLVTKGTNEPYRMMTSRSEYRLLLRQDNADKRMCEYGYRVGLLPKERYDRVQRKYEEIEKEKQRMESTVISPLAANPLLERYETTPVKSGVRLAELLRRPQLDYEALKELDTNRPELDEEIIETASIEIKYDGYIKRQLSEARKQQSLESKALPEDIDYNDIKGLRLEARQKLNAIRPKNIGQAQGISGVSPADISVLIITLWGGKE